MKLVVCLFCVSLLAAHAAPRSSASYSISTDAASAGGGRATSAAYTNNASAGGVVGSATVASPAEKVNSGFIGQLYEVDHLHINSAPPDTLAELGTKQLSLIQVLDDDSVLATNLAQVVWTTQFGPVTPVDASGVAHAGTVFQDTLWQFRAAYEGAFALSQLTILNVNNDNHGTYAADGLDDAWQVQFFGLNNPNAAPGIDADFDGQDNRFEFIAGLSPIDPAARFLLNPAPVPGQPGQMKIVISPRLPDRSYIVKSSPTLGVGVMWNDLTSFSTEDNGSIRTIIDFDATGPRKFYRVDITKP